MSLFGETQIAKLLIDTGADVSAKDCYGNTALHISASHENIGIVKALLDAGADVNAVNNNGDPVLHHAMSDGPECVKFLIDHGANIHLKGEGGDTLLHRAAQSSSDLVRDLVKGGADLEATNDEGATALHCAAAWGETASMQIIIERGANVKATNNDGETVLHIVAGNPSLRSGRDSGTKAKLLIDAGADIHAKAKSSKTPLDYAVDCEGKAVEKVLREMGAA